MYSSIQRMHAGPVEIKVSEDALIIVDTQWVDPSV